MVRACEPLACRVVNQYVQHGPTGIACGIANAWVVHTMCCHTCHGCEALDTLDCECRDRFQSVAFTHSQPQDAA